MQNISSKAAPIGHLAIRYYDLQFKKIPVVVSSPQGNQYIKKIGVGMPKIPQKILDCIVYLYASEKDAKEGRPAGGTGFLVGVDSKLHSNYQHIYAITNWHVAIKGSFSVIRLNTADNKTATFNLEPQDWTFIRDKDDIAVSPILNIAEIHKVSFINTSLFITDDLVSKVGLGIGDDTFMVGRFPDHDGRFTNKPAVRFGNISIMPTLIKQGNGYAGESYCLDVNSRKGFSGSPVFVYRTIGNNLDESFSTGKPLSEIQWFFYLLGIHWAEYEEEWQIRSINKDRENQTVLGPSGITCVIPAQRIMDLLNLPAVREEREKEEEKLLVSFRQKGFPPVTQ